MRSTRQLETNDEYQELRERVDELEARVDETVSGMTTHDDFVGAFQDLQSDE